VGKIRVEAPSGKMRLNSILPAGSGFDTRLLLAIQRLFPSDRPGLGFEFLFKPQVFFKLLGFKHSALLISRQMKPGSQGKVPV
jgi:hypothetical protein